MSLELIIELVFEQVFTIVRMAGIVVGIGLLSYAFGYFFLFIGLRSTFTVHETICRKCDKKFKSRNRIMSELKYQFHKVYACVRTRNPEG